MILNKFEESNIKNNALPASWQSQNSLDELEDFLQKNWEQRSVFYDDEKIESRQQFLGFIGSRGIRTKNYIGTIVFNGEQLNIFPKMFRTDKDDQDTSDLSLKHLMENLVQWLNYCKKVEYPFINISAELTDSENLKDLFITLYIGYVRNALERSLYYQYIEETEDISCIKGKINFEDYIKRKIPQGKFNYFNCTYSNFEFDNRINRIIKYTLRLLFRISSKENQKEIRGLLTKLNDVSDVVCSASDCNGIKLSKMHSNYRIIVSMSKMFLLNKMTEYNVDTQESFCFLFPSEILFEGFIGGYMQEVIGEHGGKVYLQRSEMNLIEDVQYAGQSLGTAFTMRHDILIETRDKVFVIDTKYKQVSRFEGDNENVLAVVREEPKQTDIYQVCEYARKRGLEDVFLLYPMFRYEDVEPYYPVGISRSPKGDINIHFVRLPFIFEDNEDIREKLKEIVKEIVCI